MKKLLPLFLILLMAACKEKDLSEDNPAPPEENLRLSSSYLYGEEALNPDSLYENNLGHKFYIDDVKFLLSHFYLVNNGDTIVEEKSKFFTYSLDNQGQLITKLPKGGYSANYGATLGVDSAVISETDIKNSGSVGGLKDQDMIRNDETGYNALVIMGRVLDPLTPLDSVGKPFRYEVGGYLLHRMLRSDRLNFSVVNNMEARFFVVLNVEPVLADFNILKRLSVTSDLQNTVDYNLAKVMLDTLTIDLF